MALAKKDATLLSIITVVAIVVACFLGWWAYGWVVTPPPQAPVKEVATATYQPFQDFTEHPYRTGFGILALILVAFTVHKWYPETWDKHIVKGLVVPVAGWIVCIYFLVLISPFGEFARAHMFEAVPLIFQFALGYGVWMLNQNPKAKPLKHRLGVILIWFTVGVLVMTIWAKNPIWGAKVKAVWASINTPPAASVPGQSIWVRGTATLNPPTERFDEECKARASIVNAEMREKIKVDFKDHPFMIPVACRESGYNQTKSGTTEVLKGEKDPNDHGVFQINLTNHAAKIAELKLDVDKYEGQVAYARYLLSTPQGINHWFPVVSGRWYAPMDIAIPITKDWSPYIQIPELTKKIQYHIRNKKPFMAEMDGTEVVMDPTLEKSYGAAKKIRFKSIDGNDSVMDIPIEFHPVP